MWSYKQETLGGTQQEKQVQEAAQVATVCSVGFTNIQGEITTNPFVYPGQWPTSLKGNQLE